MIERAKGVMKQDPGVLLQVGLFVRIVGAALARPPGLLPGFAELLKPWRKTVRN